MHTCKPCLGVSCSSWSFPFVFGLLVNRLCGHALGGVSVAPCLCRAGRGSSPIAGSVLGGEGAAGGCAEQGNPLPQQQGRKYSWQLERRRSAEPPLVFCSLCFIPDSLLLFSLAFFFQSALLPSFSFPLHSSHHKPQPAAALSQRNSSHPCVFLIALNPSYNERE